MKKLITAFALLAISSSTFATININQECLEAARRNNNLEKQLRAIQLDVVDYSLDSSKGYSEMTGQILTNMTCAPFVKAVEKSQFDLCKEIDTNVKAYQIDQADGFSPDTARILNRMGHGDCL